MIKKLTTILFFTSCLFLFGCDSNHSQPESNQELVVVNNLTFPNTAAELNQQTETVLIELTQDIASIESNPSPSFSTTIVPLNDLRCRLSDAIDIAQILFLTSPVEELRDAGLDSLLQFEDIGTVIYQNQALFQAVEWVATNSPLISGEQHSLLKILKTKFVQNGAQLNDADRTLFAKQDSRIKLLCRQFESNVYSTSDQTISFSAEQLQGVPEEFLEQFCQDADGNYLMIVNSYNHYILITTYAELETSRKTAFSASHEVGKEYNPQLLEEIVQLRTKNANLLGFDSHADFKLSTRMVGSTADALEFLTHLSDITAEPFSAELNQLQQLKREHTANPEAIINNWDINYYQQLRDSVTLTAEPLFTPTFTMADSLHGLFNLCETIFTIQIVEQQPEQNAIWQQDVQYYLVEDGSSGQVLGSFYLDLYPRDNKYSWFATTTLVRGNTYADNTRQLPAAAIICNFPQATPDQLAPLSREDVEILFHEFGHLLHFILYQGSYGYLGGFDVPLDFVEVPSTLLQQATSDPDVLLTMTTNDQKVSPDVLRKKIEDYLISKPTISPTQIRYKLAKSLFDLTLHNNFSSEDSIDTVELDRQIMRDEYLPYPEGSAFSTRFTHLVAGYDSGFYGYLWSASIVADLVSVFNDSADGFYDPAIGLKLRQEIFAPGASRDVNESVRQFLGRDWNTDAYMQKIDEL